MGAHMFCIRIFRCVFLYLMSFELRIKWVNTRVLVRVVVDVGSKLSLKKSLRRSRLFICTRKAESCNDHVTCRTSERVRERGTARQAGARLNPYRQRTTEAFSRWKALHMHTASRQSCEEKW